MAWGSLSADDLIDYGFVDLQDGEEEGHFNLLQTRLQIDF